MMNISKQAMNDANDLREYVDLEYNELGETWEALVTLMDNCDYLQSPIVDAIANEIKLQLRHIRNHSTIQEKTNSFGERFSKLVWSKV